MWRYRSLAKLREDGRAGPSTTEAIRHFQGRNMRKNPPDGRVDPGGRTLRSLANGGGERGTGETPETRKVDRQQRSERVDARVQETAVTTRLIDALVPHLTNVRAKIIAGFLSDADQFWKVNYHWEYLVQMVSHSLRQHGATWTMPNPSALWHPQSQNSGAPKSIRSGVMLSSHPNKRSNMPMGT